MSARNLPEQEVFYKGYLVVVNYGTDQVRTNALRDLWIEIFGYLYDEGFIVDPEGNPMPRPSLEVIEKSVGVRAHDPPEQLEFWYTCGFDDLEDCGR